MIISVTSLKGGVGKSTISQNLAVCFAHMGYKVAVIDTDTNSSSVHWSGLRNEELPLLTVFGITESNALRKNVKNIHKDYDLLIIDGTPALSKLVSTIILLGDIVLIPIRPSGLDIWASQKFLERFEQAKTLKDDIEAYFILNQYDQNLNFNKEVKEVIEEMEIPVLKSTLRSRVAYVESIVQGKGVYEYKDRKAKSEVVDLSNEVLEILKAKQ